jgi:hypothetical protein
VSFNSAISGSAWARVAPRAVSEFNRLSRRHRLGVRLTVIDGGVANIIVNTADGSASFSIGSQTHTVTLAGNALQGHTSNLSRSGVMFQSYVFLPSQPQVNTPGGRRPVGDGVKLVIAVHEFIHSCGLSNSEHSSDDIFTGFPSVDYGATPNRDTVVIQASGQRRRTAPPLFLGTTTISRVRRLWGTQRSSETTGGERTSATRSGIMSGMANRSGDVHGVRRRPGPAGMG